jgi:hypothetical protein
MPCAVTGVFLVLCRLDFIAAAGGDQAGKEEKGKTRFHCVYLVLGLCFLVTDFVTGTELRGLRHSLICSSQDDLLFCG